MARQIIIATHMVNSYGALRCAWRMPGVDPVGHTSFDAKVAHPQAAERGKLLFLLLCRGRQPHVSARLNAVEKADRTRFAVVGLSTRRACSRATSDVDTSDTFSLAIASFRIIRSTMSLT